MGFFEFLRLGDFSSLSELGVFDILLSLGLIGFVSILFGIAALLVGVVGALSRPKPILPMIFGFLSLAIGILGAYYGYRIANSRIMASGGWETVERVEVACGADLCMMSILVGAVGLTVGFAAMLGNVIATEVRAKKGREGE